MTFYNGSLRFLGDSGFSCSQYLISAQFREYWLAVFIVFIYFPLGNNLDAIHDITVAYPQNIPQTEKHLLYGNFPKEIHFHVQRYPVQSLPTSREELQLWCQKRWEEKEERLRLFYEGKKYFDATGRSKIPPCKSEFRVMVVKCISLFYWTSFTLAMFVLLYLYSFVRWYFVILVVIFVMQQKAFGGLELLELACHRFFSKKLRNSERD